MVDIFLVLGIDLSIIISIQVGEANVIINEITYIFHGDNDHVIWILAREFPRELGHLNAMGNHAMYLPTGNCSYENDSCYAGSVGCSIFKLIVQDVFVTSCCSSYTRSK